MDFVSCLYCTAVSSISQTMTCKVFKFLKIIVQCHQFHKCEISSIVAIDQRKRNNKMIQKCAHEMLFFFNFLQELALKCDVQKR